VKASQSIDFSLRLASSPKTILAEGGEPLLLELLKGISFDLKLHIWRKIADVVMKLMESPDFDASQIPILAGIAPVALLKISGRLDIEVDEHMKSKLTENPLLEVALIDASSLIASTSNVSSEDDAELEEHINSVLPP
jgi:hypothetical protein